MNCITLKDILEENNYKYQQIDITDKNTDLTILTDSCTCTGVPIIEKDGKFFCGFNEELLLEFLK